MVLSSSSNDILRFKDNSHLRENFDIFQFVPLICVSAENDAQKCSLGPKNTVLMQGNFGRNSGFKSVLGETEIRECFGRNYLNFRAFILSLLSGEREAFGKTEKLQFAYFGILKSAGNFKFSKLSTLQ